MLVQQDTQMVSSQDVISGIFKEEIKNRFLCLVNVNGEDTLCYIPSSCRLSNFIKLEGRTVLLKPVVSAYARTHYSVYAVKIGRSTVLLNLSMANRIVEQQLQRRSFAFLGKRSSVLREHMESGYKADLFIRDTNTIIEVKGLLWIVNPKSDRNYKVQVFLNSAGERYPSVPCSRMLLNQCT